MNCVDEGCIGLGMSTEDVDKKLQSGFSFVI